MEITKIDNSSQIDAIGYENEVLLVKFKTGVLYSYSGVPKELYDQMCEAPSKGKFLNESIKSKYAYTKLAGF